MSERDHTAMIESIFDAVMKEGSQGRESEVLGQVGAELESYRQGLGLNREILAEQMDIDSDTLCLIENGFAPKETVLQYLEQYCSLLHVSNRVAEFRAQIGE